MSGGCRVWRSKIKRLEAIASMLVWVTVQCVKVTWSDLGVEALYKSGFVFGDVTVKGCSPLPQ